MDLPNKLRKGMNGFNEDHKLRGGLHTHTFIYTIEEAENNIANDTIKSFCDVHNVVSMVFDRYNQKLIYRLIYKD